MKNHARRIATKRHDSGCHLIEYSPKREDICSRIEAFALDLFRRHIRSRSSHNSWAREVISRIKISNRWLRSRHQRFCQAEIKQLCLAASGYENICGLNIAVNDSFSVSGIERVGDLDANCQNRVQVHRPSTDLVL